MWKFSYPCLLICRRIVLNQILSYLKIQKTREKKRLKNAKKLLTLHILPHLYLAITRQGNS